MTSPWQKDDLPKVTELVSDTTERTVCRTVGEVIVELQKYDPATSVHLLDLGVVPVLFNKGQPGEELEFCAARDGWAK